VLSAAGAGEVGSGLSYRPRRITPITGCPPIRGRVVCFFAKSNFYSNFCPFIGTIVQKPPQNLALQRPSAGVKPFSLIGFCDHEPTHIFPDYRQHQP
jgi:hypothetical protein